MLSWIKKLRKSTKAGIQDISFKSVKNDFSKTTVPALSDALKTVPIFKVPKTNEVKFGNSFAKNVVPDMRAGSFNSAFQKIGSTKRVSPTVEFSAKNLFRKVNPDVELSEVSARNINTRTSSPDLNIKFANVTEFDRLPTATKSKILKSFTKLTKKSGSTLSTIKSAFTTIAIAGGTVGAVIAITQAINNRNGCWAVVNINGKNQYCKLARRSCGGKLNDTCGTAIDYPAASNVFYMIIMAYTEMDLRKKIEDFLGKPINFDDIPDFISANITKLTDFHGKNTIEVKIGLCEDHQKRRIDGCVMCDPTAEPGSAVYVDGSILPDNISYKCIQDSSVGDVFSDLGSQVGGIIGNVFTGIWPYIFIAGFALFIVYLFSILNKRPQYIPAPPVGGG